MSHDQQATTTNIVVVGGGTGGTLAANLLAKKLGDKIKTGKIRVYLLTGSKYHVFQPGYLDIAFRGKDPKKLVREEQTLIRRDVTLTEEARRIDLKAQTVHLKSGSTIHYDHIIIATGSVANPSAIPGLAEAALNFHTSPAEAKKIWTAIQQFDGGHVVVGIAGLPHKCPPSPNEAVFLLDDHLRKRGVREKVKVTFVTPYPRPYPAEPMSRVVEPRFQERDIEVVSFFNVESVDPGKREIYSLEGESLQYDLLLMVPPHRGAQVIVDSGIGDKDGWIPTDKATMKIIRYDNAYAIGDTTNIPVSKTGVTAHLEAIVAVNNVVAQYKRRDELWKYNGRINCPFEMGSGKAAFVIGSYDMPVKEVNPSRLRYLMKKAFVRFYWRTLSGNWDWLLNAYFGKTHEVENVPPPTTTKPE
jgi:sulfide:quinone oxidoreductase